MVPDVPEEPVTQLAIKKLNTSDDFLTPPEIVESMGMFDLDPCASSRSAKSLAPVSYRFPEDDGLMLPWSGAVFCNPPFSELQKWVNRFILHGNGVLLVPARVEVSWFWKLWHNCDAFFFTKGPVKYICPEGKAPPVFWWGILRNGCRKCPETVPHPIEGRVH
jgi:hypothetical protein